MSALGHTLPFSNDRSQHLNLVPLLAQFFASEFQLQAESRRTSSTRVLGRQSDLNLPIVLMRFNGSFSLELTARAGL